MARPVAAFLLGLTLLLVASAQGWAAGPHQPVQNEHAQVQLIADYQTIAPGQTFWVMVHIRARAGWHTYWRNPGDSGQATQVSWLLPEGFEAGAINWPLPSRIPFPPLTNYGYKGEAALLVPVTAPDRLTSGDSFVLEAQVDYLVCQEICVPEAATVSLSLGRAAGDALLDLRWRELFARALAQQPRPVPWPVTYSAQDGQLVVQVAMGQELSASIENLVFFPFENGLTGPGAPQRMVREPDRLLVVMPLADGVTPPATLDGVLVVHTVAAGQRGNEGFEISAPAGEAVNLPTQTQEVSYPWMEAILLALLGGLILNLMPCVLPVLSLKALAVLTKAEKGFWHIRIEGLLYTLGVLLAFMVVAGIMLGLRAAGYQIGWGFQMQEPAFIGVLALLLFALGLSLSGLFTIGGRFVGAGESLLGGNDYASAFLTGVLAAVVATPCTAPFMAAALGIALALPTGMALGVFAALGLGLALPFLIISFVPDLGDRLPRPGPWMEVLRKALAYPLYATVIWLLWVMGQQVGMDGVAAILAAMALIPLAIWVWRDTRVKDRRWHYGGMGAVALLGLALIGLLWFADTRPPLTAQMPDGPLQGEPWSPERLAFYRAEQQPIFLNVTAAWCITCKVNERVTLRDNKVAAHFYQNGIHYLLADWTSRDDEITELLTEHGRAGVPLYLYYRPGAETPEELPQVLTPDLLIDRLD